jgi:hypothetical protein
MKACIASTIAALALTLAASSASAQEGGQRGLGVGAQSMLTSDSVIDFNGGVAGASLTYDAGAFHIDGIFGLLSRNGTSFGLGGSFWYTIHGGGLADLSIGGGLGFADDDDGDGTDVHLQAGAKIRLFLVSNVALHATLGLGFIFEDDDDDDGPDDDTFVLAGQNVSGMGITYFF